MKTREPGQIEIYQKSRMLSRVYTENSSGEILMISVKDKKLKEVKIYQKSVKEMPICNFALRYRARSSSSNQLLVTFCNRMP